MYQVTASKIKSVKHKLVFGYKCESLENKLPTLTKPSDLYLNTTIIIRYISPRLPPNKALRGKSRSVPNTMEIKDILKDRIELFNRNPVEYLKVKGTTYNKDWAKAVQCFQLRINKDRKKEKKPEFTFIVIRQKLAHVKEIDDLRTFYKMCLEYSYSKDEKTKKRNTFSKCFFGALKI